MNEQLLSDFKTPHINGVAARRILSNQILFNIYQKEIETDGRGVTQRFSNDTEGAQIRVIKVVPLKQQARELGASLNGGNFNNQPVEELGTTEYGLDIITILDRNIDIPAVTQDMIPIDLLAATMKNFTDLVNNNINAMTIAGKFENAFSQANPSFTIYDPDATDKQELTNVFLMANSKLDEGDEDNYVSMFPTDDRVCVIKASFRPTLFAKGILTLGGSNYAQEMLAKGQLSPNSKETKIENGYIGDFDGVPIHMASSNLWRLACAYNGLPENELDEVVGYFSSSIANARGIAISKEIKVIDSPNGQGIRLQPKVRMGFESFYPKGNQFIVTKKFTNPIAYLNNFDSGKTRLTKLKAPGSRIQANVVYDGTNFTVTFDSNVKAFADGCKYALTTTKMEKLTVANFSKLTGATTYTPGTPTAITKGSNKFLYVLAVDGDGTVTLKEFSITA